MDCRYLLRNETLTGIQLVGSLITLVSICFVKVEKPKEILGAEDVNEREYESTASRCNPLNRFLLFFKGGLISLARAFLYAVHVEAR